MKSIKLTCFCLSLLIIVSCDSTEIKEVTNTEVNTDTLVKEALIVEEEIVQVDLSPSCECNEQWTRSKYEEAPRISFTKNSNGTSSNTIESVLSEHSKSTVRTLIFRGYDTVPDEALAFKEIERIIIKRPATKNKSVLEGIEKFPKLRAVKIEEGTIDLSDVENWMRRIIHLDFQKCRVLKLASFTQFKNLQDLRIAVSTFDAFPSGLDSLKCLGSLDVVETRGNIDLAELNFANSPCLKVFKFGSSYNTLKGVPNGLATLDLEELNIRHSNLSQIQKDSLKTLIQQ